MTDLDNNLLANYGINIPEEDKEEFFKQLGERLEEAVGLAIIEKLSDDKAKELMELTDSADDNAVAEWLKVNAPDYDDIADRELDLLLTEVAESLAK